MSAYYDDEDSDIPSRDNEILGEEGCLFPDECCMPGFHYTSECHTAEMLMAMEEEARKREQKEPNP